MSKKSFKIKLGIVLVLMAFVITGVSYAAYIMLAEQSDTNKLSAACFNTTMTDESASISVSHTLPISDSESESLTPYSFTINNTCTLNGDFYVIISSKDGSFDDEGISYSYSLDGTTYSHPYVLSKSVYNTSFNIDSGYSNSYVIYIGTLKKTNSQSFYVRLWINDRADYSKNVGKDWEGKVKVMSVPSFNKGATDPTISYTYNNESTEKSYTSFIDGLKEHYYKGTATCTNGVSALFNQYGQLVVNNQSGVETTCSVNFEDTYDCYDSNESKVACDSTEIKTSSLIGFGTEKFYVVSNRGGTIRAFAKYNLNVGDNLVPGGTVGLQNENARGQIDKTKYPNAYSGDNFYGAVVYATPEGGYYSLYSYNAYSSNGSTYVIGMNSGYSNYSFSEAKKYVDNYLTLLNSSSYANGVVTDANLISFNELQYLGCDATSEARCYSAPRWVDSSSYWTMAPSHSDTIWVMWADGRALGYDAASRTNAFGIRPAITLSHKNSNEPIISYTLEGNSTNISYNTLMMNLTDGAYKANVSCTNGVTGIMDRSGELHLSSDNVSTNCHIDFKKIYKCLDENDQEIPCDNIITGTKFALGDSDPQKFYVISNTGGKIRALAEYNLLVGNQVLGESVKKTFTSSDTGYGLQDKDSQGYLGDRSVLYRAVTDFNHRGEGLSSHQYTRYYGDGSTAIVAANAGYSNYFFSLAKDFVNEYYLRLNNTNYANGMLLGADLINLDELRNLGCSSVDMTCKNSSYPWIYNTSYWTRSAVSDTSVWSVLAGSKALSHYAVYYGYDLGIRPVITIPSTALK